MRSFVAFPQSPLLSPAPQPTIRTWSVSLKTFSKASNITLHNSWTSCWCQAKDYRKIIDTKDFLYKKISGHVHLGQIWINVMPQETTASRQLTEKPNKTNSENRHLVYNVFGIRTKYHQNRNLVLFCDVRRSVKISHNRSDEINILWKQYGPLRTHYRQVTKFHLWLLLYCLWHIYERLQSILQIGFAWTKLDSLNENIVQILHVPNSFWNATQRFILFTSKANQKRVRYSVTEVSHVFFQNRCCLFIKLDKFKPRTDEQVFLDKFYLLLCTRKNWKFFLDKKPGLKASRTSFSTRKLARVYVQQRTLDKGIFVYVLIHAAS